MRVFIVLLAVVLAAGCASTGGVQRRPQPGDSYVLARFVAIVCDDLLSDHEGSLHRLDHLDGSGNIRIVLPVGLHEQFLRSADELNVDLSRVVIVGEEEAQDRELREPYLSFSVEKDEWAVWYKCLSFEEREASDGPRTSGYAESWWVTHDGNWFYYCISHVS